MWEKIDVKYLFFISFDRIVIVIGIGGWEVGVLYLWVGIFDCG